MDQPTFVPKSLRHKKRQRQLRKRRKAANRRLESQTTSVSCESQKFNDAAAFWSNSFNSIMSWQYQHQIAYWKSKATALSYENKVLHSIIKDLYKNAGYSNTTNFIPQEIYNRKKSSRNKRMDKQQDEEECDFVLSEEMIAFLQKSAEHRMKRDLEKKKLQDSIEAAKTAPPKESYDVKRKAEMKILYGSKTDKIMGLETNLQLKFDRYVDSNNPVYWPNIPLVL